MPTETAFTENEVARRLNISPKTLQRWRSDKLGPPYFKLSKAVRYAVDDIVAYASLSGCADPDAVRVERSADRQVGPYGPRQVHDGSPQPAGETSPSAAKPTIVSSR
jgi:hypothetical protein